MEQTAASIDYSAYVDRPTDDLFARLAALADKQTEAQLSVVRAEIALKEAQEALRKVSEEELPEFMQNVIGAKEITLRDGRKVEVGEVVRAGITKARQAEAFKWLRENGHKRLIKHIIKLEFTKGEDEKATTLTELLKKHGYEADDAESVHAQTLGAFVREKLEEGTLPDEALELLGVHRQNVAKITVKK